MTPDMPLLPEHVEEGLAPAPGARGRDSIFLMVHRVLGGRYHWAILLGLLLGGLAAGAARLTVKNIYPSTGTIQVTPVMPGFFNHDPTIMPMFNSYMDAQVALILSERTIEMAMESDDWKEALPKGSSRTLGQFIDSLRVEHERDSELIEIRFRDQDPKVAAAGVKTIIDAYMRLSGESAVGSQARFIEILEGQKADRTKELATLNQQVMDIAGKYGTDDLDRLRDSKQELCITIERNISERKTQLALALASESPTTQKAATAPATAPAMKLTPELIAARGDARMRDLLTSRDRLRAELASHPSLGSSSPLLLNTQAALTAVEAEIAALVGIYEAAATQPGTTVDVAHPATNPGDMSRAQLELLIKTLQQQHDDTQEEMKEIGNKALQIRKIKTEVARAKEELDQINTQIQNINAQIQVGGRTTVQNSGTVPFRPEADKNRKMTLAGGFGGMALGVALVALRGLLDRRLKSVADAQSLFDRSKRVLGILPALPDDMTDPEQAATAAYCVHHIRTLLQLGGGRTAHSTIAVTSAGPRDGKTSLVLSLGHSYAATGTRTLLIDFDVVGMGLSLRSGAAVRRKLGDLLVREGRLTPAQRDAALARSLQTGRHLGQVLVDQGLITAQELEGMLQKQRTATLGLLDVLEGEPLADCLAHAGNNLSILTVGDVGTRRFGQLSLAQVQKILQTAREQFEVVLIDTGPVLGSLEACVVAAVADEVILVMARGQQRPLIDKAFSRLSDIGAKVAGIVFNRAADRDVEESVYTSYRGSQRPLELPPGPNGQGGQRRRLGPVARAVVDAETTADAPGSDKP